MTYIRRVKTSSGATAVQIVRKEHGVITKVVHIGSAHTSQDTVALLSLAREKLHEHQLPLFSSPARSSMTLKSSASELLQNILRTQYDRLGFGKLADEVFALLCIARIVEPTSKLDALRVLADLGVIHLTKHHLYRCLERVVGESYRTTLSSLCFTYAVARTISLVLYDVTTLYFEVQQNDAYRKSGMSKERRLEPQIVIGLLVDQTGFPLGIHSFKGNMAETKTMVPVIDAFCAEHQVKTITVVADAAMLSADNLEALTRAGHSYIVGSRLHKIPYDIAEFRKTHRRFADGQILTDHQEDYRIIYQYRKKRAALDRKNITKQIVKARRIITGKNPVSKAKFLTLSAKDKTLNWSLIAKARTLAGIKGYVTNLDIADTEVIAYYHQLFHVEASFRMVKSDFKARPIFHRKKDAIEAHLTVVFAALAIGKSLEAQTGMSIKHFVHLLRPIRSGTILINGQEYQATAEIPPNIHTLLKKLESGH